LVAVTPNNCDWTSLPRAATQGSARATPADARRNPLFEPMVLLDHVV
jgi:hypothetical protein